MNYDPPRPTYAEWPAPLDMESPEMMLGALPASGPAVTYQNVRIEFDVLRGEGIYFVDLPWRLGRWRRLSGIDALELDLPDRSVHSGYVDRRCLARYRRRARRRAA
jgi:hypothetical protein